MRAENRVFPSVCAGGDFYAILSVKKRTLDVFCVAAPPMGVTFPKRHALHTAKSCSSWLRFIESSSSSVKIAA